MQVLLLRTAVYSAKNSSHSKATKMNQRIGQVTMLSPLPFPVQMIQKSRAVLIQITLWQQGKLVTTALYSFISGAKEHFWHGECMLYFTLTRCDPLMCRGVGKKYNFQCVTGVCFQCYLVLYAESMQPLKKKAQTRISLLHKWLLTSPRWTACNQLTINTPFHSVRIERALPYFVRVGRAKTQH